MPVYQLEMIAAGWIRWFCYSRRFMTKYSFGRMVRTGRRRTLARKNQKIMVITFGGEILSGISERMTSGWQVMDRHRIFRLIQVMSILMVRIVQRYKEKVGLQKMVFFRLNTMLRMYNWVKDGECLLGRNLMICKVSVIGHGQQ